MDTPAPHEESKAKGAAKAIPVAILTTTDSRTKKDDASGDLAQSLFEAAGCRVVHRALVRNERDDIRAAVEAATAAGAFLVLTTGGTGISTRDVTVETVETLLEKRLDGFGELFRHLSFEEIGTATILSRAVMGIRAGRVICCSPGSRGAVRLALEKIVLPEIAHLHHELTK